MSLIFLQSAAAASGMLAGLGIAFLLIFLAIAVAYWIYSALAFSAIARRAGSDKGALAWIPGFGPLIVTYIISGMHWWPWLLWISLATLLIPFVGAVIYFVAILIFAIYSIIWMWKTYEAVGRPGWWAIMPIIPLVGFLLQIIFVGIAAWGSGGNSK